MKKFLICTGIVIANLLVQGVLAFFIVKMLILPALQMPDITFANASEEAAPDSVITTEAKIEELKLCTVVELANLVVNPANTRGRKFLVFSVELYIDGMETEDIERAERVVIEESIGLLVSRKDHNWLSNVMNRKMLREEIKVIVQKVLHNYTIKDVFITKFVMQ
jgi:flagellar basal body-associated protein FliL